MKAIKRWLFLLLTCCAGCNSTLSREAYVNWVRAEENGLHKRTEVGEFVFDVQYQPLEYQLVMQGIDPVSDTSHREAIEETKRMQYYELRISVAGGKTDMLKASSVDEKSYQQKLYYFSYGFQQDIHLEQDGKKHPCKFYHFERSYDLRNTRSFVLAFDEPISKEHPRVLVLDTHVLGTGIIKIKFEPQSIPAVKL